MSDLDPDTIRAERRDVTIFECIGALLMQGYTHEGYAVTTLRALLDEETCVACKHDMTHHEQPGCSECSNTGTTCGLLDDLRDVALAEHYRDVQATPFAAVASVSPSATPVGDTTPAATASTVDARPMDLGFLSLSLEVQQQAEQMAVEARDTTCGHTEQGLTHVIIDGERFAVCDDGCRCQRREPCPATPVAQTAFMGIPIKADPTIPDDEIHLVTERETTVIRVTPVSEGPTP